MTNKISASCVANRSISISLEEKLLAQLDAQGSNRSALESQALSEWLARRRIDALNTAYAHLASLEAGDLAERPKPMAERGKLYLWPRNRSFDSPGTVAHQRVAPGQCCDDLAAFLNRLTPPWPGLIALFSCVDHFFIAGRPIPIPQQWVIPLILVSVAVVLIDARLAPCARDRSDRE
jgi:hypothetical protein